MKVETRRVARRCHEVALLLASLTSVNAMAQTALPAAPPPPQGSQQLPIPQQVLPVPPQLPAQPTPFDPSNPAGASPRFLFAGALALVVKSVGASVVSGLSQGIVNWFNTRAGQFGGAPGGVAPWMPPMPMGGNIAGAYPPGYIPPLPPAGAATPWMPPTPMGGDIAGAYPPGFLPASPPLGSVAPWTPPAPVGGGIAGTYPPGSVPSTQPWMMSGPNPVTPGAPPLVGAMPAAVVPALYAGIAFEVHFLGPGGTEITVDPTTYIFRSGDRFLVYYRPSLPGRVRVSNVSPLGEVIPIETLTLAGGELAKLGPYQLTDPAGDEALRLVLEPCSTPELVAATRNIVKATDTGTGGADLHIGSCQASTSAAAGVGTRNIVKATMDGSTGFALDPVNSHELASGHLAPRETTIAIHHR
jgi:hypothetical protein